MIIGIFAVHDSATKAFCAPFFMQHDDAAIRAFKQAVNDAQSPISKSPGDYTLHRVGYWNDVAGTIVPGVEQIAQAIALIDRPASLANLELFPTNGGGSAEATPIPTPRGNF